MPNLGRRDPGIYGPIRSLDDLQALVRDTAEAIGVQVEPFASNHEGEILEFVHRTAGEVDGYLINPAGLTTYGEATRHALSDSRRPFVEVHFANIVRHFEGTVPPEQQRTSRFTGTAQGLTMGLRQHGYVAALLGLALALDDEAFLDGAGARAAG